MKRSLWSTLLVSLCLHTTAVAESIPLDPEVRTGTLDNGLTWTILENDEPEQRAYLNLVVRAGSLQEDDDQQGLAHFLEHMAFNGTENFQKQELIDYLESIGMEFGPEINAYTTADETAYRLTIPTDDPSFLETGMKILADWSRRISLEEEEVVMERGVVLDEWRGHLGAQQRLSDLESELLYAGSRYVDRKPIGDPEIVKTATADKLRRFYEDWYRPDLMSVIVVGDFNADRILELVHENFDEDWGPGEKARPLVESVPSMHEETLAGLFSDPEITRSSVDVLLKEPDTSELTVEDYRKHVVSRFVRGMFSARLRELIEDDRADFTSGRITAGQITRRMSFSGLTVSGADDQLVAALRQVALEWQRVRDHGFTESELERQKASALRSAEARWKDRDNRESSRLARTLVAVFLGTVQLPSPDWSWNTSREMIPGITLDDTREAVLPLDFTRSGARVVLSETPELKNITPPTREQLLATLQEASEAEPEPWIDDVRSEPLIAELPEPGSVVTEESIEELGVVIWTLSNGVKVFLKPTDFNTDSFSFDAFSPGGRSLGSPSLNRSQDFATAAASVGGVGDFDASELRKKLNGKLVRVQPWIARYEEGFSGGGSSEDLETALQLLWLRATEPRRDEVAFASLVDRYDVQLENRSLSPEQVFSDSVQVILTGGHPWSEPMSAASLQTVDFDESFRFFRERFADLDDLVMVMVGDLDPDTLRPLVEQYLGTLPAREGVEHWRDIGPRLVDGPLHRSIRVGVDDKARTVMILHGPAEWTRQDRFGLTVLANALEIRLREVLREDLAGTYGVSVSGSLDKRPEPQWRLNISFGCDPGRLDELVGEALRVLASVREEGLPPEYLEKVLEQVLRTNEESVRENSYWKSVIGFRERYGIDQREELDTREFIQAFGIEDLRQAAARYLPLEKLIRLDKVPAPAP